MSERALRTQHVPRFELESGEVLTNVTQAYHLDGALNEERDNLVLVFHALTGSADAVGGWWSEVVGPGKAIDTRHFAVLAPNLLGSCYGTTGPGERPDFPPVTTRDQARLAHHLVEALGVESVALVTGGSLGGMVAMEYACTFPALSRSTVVLAAPAAHTAHAIGLNHLQREVIHRCGPEGIALARIAAMLTYRTPEELGRRFGREVAPDGRFQVQSYLDHHGTKLLDRFDSASYLALLDAMDSHDVGRGRGGAQEALRAACGRWVGVGIPGDQLYSDADVLRWVASARGKGCLLRSPHGHDAFLLEPVQVGQILATELESVSYTYA